MPKKKVSSKLVQQAAWRDLVYGTMLFIVLAIMPIIVRFAVIMPPPELFAMYGREVFFDFFFHYKGWVLGICAAVILFYAIADWLMGEIPVPSFRELLKSPPFVASAIFLVMALISTLFSSYRYTSWHGTVDRGEGLLILLAYFIVLFAAMFFVRTGKNAKFLMYGFAFSSFIMGLLALTQFLQRDFFLTNMGERIIMGRTWLERIAEMSEQNETVEGRFTFAYGTLYNPNTLGKYAAMAAPILLACALAYDEWKLKGILIRIGFLLSGGLMLVAVFGSRSLAGFLAVAAAGSIVAVTLVSRFVYQMMQNREKEPDNDSPPSRNSAWVIGAVVLVIMGIGLYFVPPVNERVNLALERAGEAVLSEPEPASDIIFDNNRMTLVIREQERFTIEVNPYAFTEGTPFTDSPWELYDPSGQHIPLYNREQYRGDTEELVAIYHYDIPGHGRVALERFFQFLIFRDIAFTINEGRIYALTPVFGLIDMSEPVPTMGFEGRELWGSARGYIWSRTFPLLPSRIIIGSGPDTYVQVFPQHDVVAKSFFLPNPYTPVDKAHNVFLQTWVNTGGISAIALLFLFVYYLLTAFVATIKSKLQEGIFLFGLRFGLLAGIGAFTVASLSTDSTIGSSGVFFVLLGIGYGINLLVKRQETEQI